LSEVIFARTMATTAATVADDDDDDADANDEGDVVAGRTPNVSIGV